jgi:hypothetical protein
MAPGPRRREALTFDPVPPEVFADDDDPANTTQ